MYLLLRLVQFVSCPIGVPLGVMWRDDWEGRTLLVIGAGPAVFACTCVFVAATALADSGFEAPPPPFD